MLKKHLIFLIVFSFTVCNVWADIIKEPKIVKINDYLLVYEDAAEIFVKNVASGCVSESKEDSLKICENDSFFKMIIALYEKAKEEALSRSQKKFWVYDDAGEWGINFDSDKKLIIRIMHTTA
jgi:hypothetical protein